MPTMPDHADQEVTGGVDTHKDTHVAAAVDAIGRILATCAFPATRRGYAQLLRWMRGFGPVAKIGVEGTSSYGAGLARYLADQGVEVVEVNRPNRQARRRHGKSDPADAEAAARAALNGEASGRPKGGDGTVEAIRALRVARRSAVKARVQAANQIGALILTAPVELRERLGGLRTDGVVALAARFRPRVCADPTEVTKAALRSLARRHQSLAAEIAELDGMLADLIADVAPQRLLDKKGVGTDVAGALLVAAGDHPDRLKSERSFAALCGASPVDASSGKQKRHRLNLGGDRQANGALWRIVMVRMSCDPRTRAYVERRTKEGKTTKEIMRCLKRYIAREMYKAITTQTPSSGQVPGARAA
ncbi:MAG: IS110 family transposase [Acidimicrobiales bacterium]